MQSPKFTEKAGDTPLRPCSLWESNDLLIYSLDFDENVSSFLLQIMKSAYSIIILMSTGATVGGNKFGGPAGIELRSPHSRFFAHQCGTYAQF